MTPSHPMRLRFEAGGVSCAITCGSGAPRTLAALARTLPLPLQLHTPKIAGSHIFWQVPFVEDVEGGIDVLSAPPGALIYWPVRQFMEITFAPLQAETASVTVLGHIDGPVSRIAELGTRLRHEAGLRTITGTLESMEPGETGTEPDVPDPPDVPVDLHAARRAIWRSCPDEITALTASRAILHPVGPLMQADAEARVLHEALWWVRSHLGARDESSLRVAASLSLDRAAVRLRDFCHLPQTAETLFAACAAIDRGDHALPALLDETILLAGRIAAWIDLLIPWNAMNEAARAVLDPHQGDSP